MVLKPRSNSTRTTQELFMRQLFTAPRLAALAVTLGTLGAANAAVDLDGITAAGTDIAAVGGAVFLVMIGIKVFKWVRRAL
jgi:hypothetical protein